VALGVTGPSPRPRSPARPRPCGPRPSGAAPGGDAARCGSGPSAPAAGTACSGSRRRPHRAPRRRPRDPLRPVSRMIGTVSVRRWDRRRGVTSYPSIRGRPMSSRIRSGACVADRQERRFAIAGGRSSDTPHASRIAFRGARGLAGSSSTTRTSGRSSAPAGPQRVALGHPSRSAARRRDRCRFEAGGACLLVRRPSRRGTAILPNGERHGVRPVRHAQLVQDAGQVVLDGLLADLQQLADLAVAHARGHVTEHVQLARRQRDVRGLVRCRKLSRKPSMIRSTRSGPADHLVLERVLAIGHRRMTATSSDGSAAAGTCPVARSRSLPGCWLSSSSRPTTTIPDPGDSWLSRRVPRWRRLLRARRR
jgi:hypothetical protein